ncbi:uncharacterized protein LOC118485808 [Helianthus annuus]|uniref:uncharacterized protein LOC118485808 n=1 Tax=Helianthus annuus TaxID=4232 RepID=UPI0016530FB7|nr:uncharacterized protein LOC118485808 [Helianthus annuus]
MHIGEHFAVSWKTLRKLEVEDWVRGFVPVDSPWDRLFELSFTPTYREILVEFLSSFEFHPRRPNEVVDPAQPPPPPEVSFRMAGQAREMSLAQFAVHSGLYTEAEIATDLYTKGLVMIDKPTLLGFWDLIADIRHWDHHQSKGRSTLIEDPLFRYLHKMISTSITARNKSREWCTSGDLFFLYCLLYKRPCALAYGFGSVFRLRASSTGARNAIRRRLRDQNSPFVGLSSGERPRPCRPGGTAKADGDEHNKRDAYYQRLSMREAVKESGRHAKPA